MDDYFFFFLDVSLLYNSILFSRMPAISFSCSQRIHYLWNYEIIGCASWRQTPTTTSKMLASYKYHQTEHNHMLDISFVVASREERLCIFLTLFLFRPIAHCTAAYVVIVAQISIAIIANKERIMQSKRCHTPSAFVPSAIAVSMAHDRYFQFICLLDCSTSE